MESCLPQWNKDEITPHALLIKVEADKVRSRVNNYTKDHISILDKETFSLQLSKIDELNVSFQDWIASSTCSLDDSITFQLETLNERRKVSDELDLYVKQNADEVKAKFVKFSKKMKKVRRSQTKKEEDWIKEKDGKVDDDG